MKEITDRGIDHLAEMKNLKKLDIGSAEITARSVETLARIATLEELNLGGKDYTDDQVAPLGALKHLKSVSMGAGTNSKLTDKTLMTLKDMPLESLSISGEFTDEGVRIVGGMPRLGDLMLMIAPHLENKVTDRGIAYLSGLRNLEMLTLFNVKGCTLSGLSPLQLPRLRHIHVTDIQQNYKGMDISGMPAMEDTHHFDPRASRGWQGGFRLLHGRRPQELCESEETPKDAGAAYGDYRWGAGVSGGT